MMLTMQCAGYIGKGAETRATQGGDTATSWSVGVNTGRDKTTWVSCTMWGERGEKLAQYLTKGSFVAVTGFPSARAWKDQSGDARAELGMSVDRVSFGPKSGGKPDGDSASDYRQASGGAASAGAYDDSGEIPFSAEWR